MGEVVFLRPNQEEGRRPYIFIVIINIGIIKNILDPLMKIIQCVDVCHIKKIDDSLKFMQVPFRVDLNVFPRIFLTLNIIVLEYESIFAKLLFFIYFAHLLFICH
jgi:hypothetical protein